MRKSVIWLGAILLLAAGAVPALARAAAPAYVTSDPQNGATVSSPPSRVSVTFSEPLDESSTLQVFDQCGRSVDAGDAQVLGSRIDVGIAEAPSGHYTAVYVARGFGGATGETKGSISFHVTSGEPCDGGDDHGGHGNPGGGGSENNGHEGHGGGDDDGGDEHDGHRGDGTMNHDDDHPGGSSSTHHGSGGDDHDGGDDDHAGNDHGDSHGDGNHGGGHGGDRSAEGPRDANPNPKLASGRGGPGLAPTSSSVLIALGLSVAMGALGGWVLRVSAGS